VSYPAQKVHALGGNAARGGSGSRAVPYDIEQLFDPEPDAVVEARDVGSGAPMALQAYALLASFQTLDGSSSNNGQQ
jgi:hypothetical protein